MGRRIHGGDIYSYIKKSDNEKLIDFSANTNPLGLPEGVKKAIVENMNSFGIYPDPWCRELTKQIALHENVPQSYILCGNGAADLIYRIAAAIRPRATLVTAPTFSEYEDAVRTVDSSIKYYYLKKDKGFTVDTGILEAVDSAVDLVFLCNPNNPTGTLTDKTLVLALAEKCKENNSVLAVDECFIDFLENSRDFSIVDCLKAHENIIALKAFTKTYSMAGIRLGYAICCNKAIIERLGAVGQPWSVSAVAQHCGIAALKEKDYLHKTQQLTEQNREYLTLKLRALGYQVFTSQVNYILLRAENRNLHKELELYGILIRACDNYVGLDNTYFRIAVKSQEDNEYLVRTLEKIRIRA